MQVSFDPTNPAEVALVRALLPGGTIHEVATAAGQAMKDGAAKREPKVVGGTTAADKLADKIIADTKAASNAAQAEAAKSAASPVVPTQTTEAPAVTATQTTAPSPTSAITQDAVRALIVEVGKVKGRDAAVALLDKFHAVSLPTLKPENYAAFVEAAKAKLAEGAAS